MFSIVPSCSPLFHRVLHCYIVFFIVPVWRAPDLSVLSAQQDVPASGLSTDLPSSRRDPSADFRRLRADSASERTSSAPNSSAPNSALAGRFRETPPNVRDSESARRPRDGDAESRVGEESRVQGESRVHGESRVQAESRVGTGEATRLPGDVESAEVEAWLDEHPDFAKDYFMR